MFLLDHRHLTLKLNTSNLTFNSQLFVFLLLDMNFITNNFEDMFPIIIILIKYELWRI